MVRKETVCVAEGRVCEVLDESERDATYVSVRPDSEILSVGDVVCV